MEKVCTMCGRLLPIEQFPTNRGMADGHLGKCFECWPLFTGALGAKSEKERLKHEERKQKEKAKEQNRKPRRSRKNMTPEEIRESILASKRASYQRLKADPERYAQHLAKHRENAKKWYYENRDVINKKRSIEGHREENRSYYQRLKADPERYAQQLAKGRERWKKWYYAKRDEIITHEPMSECERRHQRRMLQAKEREENKEKQPALKPVKTYNHELRNIAKSGD